MSRVQRSNEFEDQDYYPPPPRRGDDARDFRRPRSPPPGRSPPRRPRSPSLERERERERGYDDVPVRLREREASRGPPAFLREEGRRPEQGPMVLRKREVETIDRHDVRPRGSPSPPPPRRMMRRMSSSPPPRRMSYSPPPPSMMRGRSPSPRRRAAGPPPEVEHLRSRFVETTRVRSPSEVRARRSPSPRGARFDDRRPRSFSPPEQTRVRTRIIDRERERDRFSSPSHSPSPPPGPHVVRGPTIERDVITHYRDIDHGMVQARPPSPQAMPRPPPMERSRPLERTRGDETDIDISLGRNRTEVDVVRRTTRSGSRERTSYYHDDDLGYDRFQRDRSSSMRMPPGRPMEDEGREITSRIDSRGRMGESWGGATRDWTIVDVPPGTERVRMDGKGGGSTDTTWSKYSGVRRTQFIPERDGALVPVNSAPEPTPLPPTSSRDRVSVSVQSRNTEIDIDKTSERRLVRMPQPPQPQLPMPVTTKRDVWTEITKDLVSREAIERLGYPYEEHVWHYYIMDYLHFHQVKELTELSDQIRRARRRPQKPKELPRYKDDFDVRYHRHRHYYDFPPPQPLPQPRPPKHHHHHHHHHHGGGKGHWDYEEEMYREKEVIWDSKGRRWERGREW